MPKTTKTPEKAPRKVRTPAQRAQAALDLETRRVTKLEGKRDTLKTELEAVSRDLVAAQKRRQYLAANPDLPEPADAYDALTTDAQEGDPS